MNTMFRTCRAALTLMLAAPAACQTPSPAMQRAILDGMNAERAPVERRATGELGLWCFAPRC